MQYSGNVTEPTPCLGSISGRASASRVWKVESHPEGALVEKAQNGDLAAFNELVLMYQEVVYRQALWLLQEETAAEDAAQEAFLKAYRNLHRFTLGKPFRSWLLKIATNHCLDMIRKAQRHPRLPLERRNAAGEEIEEAYWMKDPQDTPEQAVEKAEAERRIAHAIQRLAPEYRAVIILADLQELDYAEVSAILAVPLGTMKSRLSRARRKLREALL